MKTQTDNLGQPMVKFLKALKRNNKREWFHSHQEQYELSIKRPARVWLEQFRPLVIKSFAQLEVSPRSIYRINRDTRFTDDKTPYKTWIGFLFRDRRFAKDLAPALYVGMDPTGIALGAGIWRFEGTQRAVFRERVTTEPGAAEFMQASRELKRAGFEVMGRDLKKIPKGYDPDHPNAPYLLHNGLYASRELDFPKSFGTARFASDLARILSPCRGLMEWMARHLRG